MGMDCDCGRCGVIHEAGHKASLAAHKAIFEAIRDDETIPEDNEKILASLVAIVSTFMGMAQGVTKPDNEMPRKAFLQMVETSIAPAIAAAYQAEEASA